MTAQSGDPNYVKHTRWWQRFFAYSKFSRYAALLGGLIYLIQSLVYAHFQDITMDEGTYLMKGLLYVTGVYRPFQLYGPNTNKMPFSFLIPGWVQELFVPGLRTGRYFAVLISLLIVVGLWLVTRRLAGEKWAAAAVWIMAISPANLFFYSQALTQGLVACLLVWMLVLVAGPKRTAWQLIVGGILAASIVLTRQNMLPVLLFLVVYVGWEHGWKGLLLSSSSAALLMLFVHLLYWPNILILWQPWAPAFLQGWFRQELSAFNGPISTGGGGGASVWNPNSDLLAQLQVVWEGVRFNFFGTAGMFATWLFWPRRSQWKSDSSFKLVLSLSGLLVLLIVAHAWAALSKDYCLYCYSGYLSFFMPTAVLLIAVASASWITRPGGLRQFLGVVLVWVGCTGIAFSGYQALAPFILKLPVPRVRNLHLLPGSSELWRLLSNKYNLAYGLLEIFLPTLFGLLVGVLLLLLAYFIVRHLRERRKSANIGRWVLALFIGLGLLLTPTTLMAGSKLATNLCNQDVIISHEKAGAELRALIPSGSLVYWMNNVSPLPLLYLPKVRVFPPQLNQWYTFRDGGNPDYLERTGYWNQALADRWLQQADFALVEDKYVVAFSSKVGAQYDELHTTSPVVSCQDRSNIHIYKRIKP